MPPYEKHVLVCTSCEGCPGFKVLKELRQSLKGRGLNDRIRAQGADCFDACDFEDAVVVVYPEGVWYGKVGVADVEEILESHLIGGRPVARKLIDFAARTVGGEPLPPPQPSACAAPDVPAAPATGDRNA